MRSEQVQEQIEQLLASEQQVIPLYRERTQMSPDDPERFRS